MQNRVLDNVIATRTFTLNGPGRARRRVTVSFGAPRPFPDGRNARCGIQIVGLGDERVRFAGGVDQVHALELAHQVAAILLMTTPEYRAGRLLWLGRTDLGLPLVEALVAIAAEAKESRLARKRGKAPRRRQATPPRDGAPTQRRRRRSGA